VRGLSVLTLALAASGCVTARPAPPPGELLLKLSPRSLGRELQLSQRITVLRGAERKTFEAQLEVDEVSVRIAALALGQTVASLTWDGKQLAQQVSTQVPAAITADRILSDVQLAWWPTDAIRAALPARYALDESGARRVLKYDGVRTAQIDYTGTAPAWSRVHLTQLRHGYELDIESVELAP
jgi:hypothetical protein